MGEIIGFPRPSEETGLHRLLAGIVWRAHSVHGSESLFAMRFEERIYVAGSFAYSYLIHVGFAPRIIEYDDLARLNAHEVAAYVEAELDGEGQAGIVRTIKCLIDEARKCVDEPTAA